MNDSIFHTKSGAEYAGLSIDQVLDQYPVAFRQCRALGRHNWARGFTRGSTDVVWVALGRGQRQRTSRCLSCGCTKTEILDAYFRRMERPTMDYVPGYKVPKTGVTQDDFRTLYFQDEFDQALQESAVFNETGVTPLAD